MEPSYEYPLGDEGAKISRSHARQIVMLDRWEQGETLEQIGHDYGLTREGVRRNAARARAIREFWYKRFADGLAH